MPAAHREAYAPPRPRPLLYASLLLQAAALSWHARGPGAAPVLLLASAQTRDDGALVNFFPAAGSSAPAAGSTVVPPVPTALGSCACDQTSAAVASPVAPALLQPVGPNLDACDVNCCCDPDCASLSYLFSLGADGAPECRPEGPDPPRVEYWCAARARSALAPASAPPHAR